VRVNLYRYVYLGDRWTDARLAGRACNPVRRADGRCIVSGARASALVSFDTGERHVVARRRLRLVEKVRGARSEVQDRSVAPSRTSDL
jgi:hypothetical protein